MNRNITIIFLILFTLTQSCTTNGQDKKGKSKVSELLPENIYEFEMLDSVKTTPRQEELTFAFQRAYQEKMDIFNSYFEKVRNKEEASFPQNKYLTESDFKEYMEFAENIVLIPSTTEKIEVIYSKDNITFKSSGKLEILNYIRYKSSTNEFEIEDYKLSFKDSTNVTDKNNALQESWNGYIWEFVDPKDIEMPTQETIGQISIKQYKITLGTLEQSGKIFMILKGREYHKGQPVVNFEIPIRLK